jgi:hypothetical protein
VIYSLTEGNLNPPAAGGTIEGLTSTLGGGRPRELFGFPSAAQRGEGFIGNNYLVLWKAEELADFNREYEVEKYATGILLFGSDGGGEGYGFDTQSAGMPIVRVPLIGMERRYATPVAKDFPELFAKLAIR